jgi:HEPN domain-containing protein
MAKENSTEDRSTLMRFLIEKGDEAYTKGRYEEAIYFYDAAVEEMLQLYLECTYGIPFRSDLESVINRLKEKGATQIVQFIERLRDLRSGIIHST